MNRREFLKTALITSAIYGAGGLSRFGSVARADGFAAVSQRMMVNINLHGGPDMRALFPPAYNATPGTFGHEYWKATATAHDMDQDNTAAHATRWANEFFHVSDGPFSFGISKHAEWLKDMWDAGKVALICNTFGINSRDHVHAQLILNQGNISSSNLDINRSGWGGRLAAFLNANVLALTKVPTKFCNGPHPSDPEDHDNALVIAAPEMRNLGLFRPDASHNTYEHALANSLEQYYAAKRTEIADTSPYYRLFDMDRKLREFGDPVIARLDTIPTPADLEALHIGANRLNNVGFGLQINNLYDALACNDILDMRVASLQYGALDTHDTQRQRFDDALDDLFGRDGGLDVLFRNLPADAKQNTLFVLAGEFGRQIRSNGEAGTDHGQGTMTIIIGDSVNGGVYGDMFPEEELARVWTEETPHIIGQTSFEHVLAAACNWVAPSSADIIFPNRNSGPIEPGLDLASLFV